MAAKPSFIGLLNAIALGEAAAAAYLRAWADTTADSRVEEVLRFVALRESEHAAAFEKRLAELGYSLRPATDPSVARRQLRVAKSAMSDAEKFEHFRIAGPPGETDVFDGMFRHKDLDPQTGALLGRYIAEERDTGRRFAACYRTITRSPTRKARAAG